jgi:hypothetical protein
MANDHNQRLLCRRENPGIPLSLQGEGRVRVGGLAAAANRLSHAVFGTIKPFPAKNASLFHWWNNDKP